MDIEFHYYITYLVAARAGFAPQQASVIAYASQYVDDNDIIHEINVGFDSYYSNYISQTINIFKPKRKLLRIYPLFHFIPGEPMAESARRKDGKLHYLNTTPNSMNAQSVLRAALDSGDLYRLGIAVHACVDTWAHENFVGYFDEMNALKGLLEKANVALIGHAAAKHDPDRIGVVWHDCRLVSERGKRNNLELFLSAAGCLFVELRKYLAPNTTDDDLLGARDELVRDIRKAVGQIDQDNKRVEDRIARYRKLALKSEYGGCVLPRYDEDSWFDQAIQERVRFFRIRGKHVWSRTLRSYIADHLKKVRDIYVWKSLIGYQETHWFKFQEAVKAHQKAATEILKESTFGKMELEHW